MNIHNSYIQLIICIDNINLILSIIMCTCECRHHHHHHLLFKLHSKRRSQEFNFFKQRGAAVLRSSNLQKYLFFPITLHDYMTINNVRLTYRNCINLCFLVLHVQDSLICLFFFLFSSLFSFFCLFDSI
jgi:hypothetical protein